ncbi:MAG: hypothetical protein WAV21_01385 [Minisyncoccia bacterium]
MTRVIFLAAPFLALIAFPWYLAVALSFLGALWVPMLGIAFGIVADALYYTQTAAAFPFGTFVGIFITGSALLLRHFLKTRVSDFPII